MPPPMASGRRYRQAGGIEDVSPQAAEVGRRQPAGLLGFGLAAVLGAGFAAAGAAAGFAASGLALACLTGFVGLASVGFASEEAASGFLAATRARLPRRPVA